MVDNNDSLLREVEEELRREQMQKFWERYNGLIIGIALAIIAAVGGYKYWEWQRNSAAETAGSEYMQAMRLTDEKKGEEAAKAFEKIASGGPEGFASLARLQIAGADAKAGKTKEAVAAYEALGRDPAADGLLKSFAQLQAASLRLGEADFTELQNRLTPLVAEGQPFRTSAQELLGLAALKAGKYDEARKQLEPLLIDPAATPSVQERVKIALARIAEAETGSAAGAEPAKAEPVSAPAEAAPAAAGMEPEAEKK